MHVLFSEAITTAASHASAELARAGHTIESCHELRDLGFACAALRGDGCPLEQKDIDVAVSVRTVDGPEPLPGDDGIFCALRHHVPVVVAGDVRAHPFLRFSHWRSSPGEPLRQTVETAARAELPEHSAAATAEARRAAGPDALARVWRSHGGLRVHIEHAGPRRDRVSVRVAGVLRELDPYARSINVSAS